MCANISTRSQPPKKPIKNACFISTLPPRLPLIQICPLARVNLDKDAAGRFIKHAIAQSKYGRPPGDDAEPTPVNARAPVRVTSKMEARAQYERELKELGSDEDEGDDLQMFDGEEGEESEGDEVEEAPSTGKGKEKAIDVDEAMEDEPPVGTKRRRARMDPFAGKI